MAIICVLSLSSMVSAVLVGIVTRQCIAFSWVLKASPNPSFPFHSGSLRCPDLEAWNFWIFLVGSAEQIGDAYHHVLISKGVAFSFFLLKPIFQRLPCLPTSPPLITISISIYDLTRDAISSTVLTGMTLKQSYKAERLGPNVLTKAQMVYPYVIAWSIPANSLFHLV